MLKVMKRAYTDKQKKIIRGLIGNNLKVARKNAGMTQTDVMREKYGITNNRNRISEIENGVVEISVYDLLIFADMYGQSVDYILGRSCEPINDVLASSINNVQLNLKKYLEPIIEAATDSVIAHIKRIGKDEYLELLTVCDALGHYVFANGIKLAENQPELYNLLMDLSHVTRKIRIGEAHRERQMYAQMDAIIERHDKEDGHQILDDLKQPKQYTLSLPQAEIEIVEVEH